MPPVALAFAAGWRWCVILAGGGDAGAVAGHRSGADRCCAGVWAARSRPCWRPRRVLAARGAGEPDRARDRLPLRRHRRGQAAQIPTQPFLPHIGLAVEAHLAFNLMLAAVIWLFGACHWLTARILPEVEEVPQIGVPCWMARRWRPRPWRWLMPAAPHRLLAT